MTGLVVFRIGCSFALMLGLLLLSGRGMADPLGSVTIRVLGMQLDVDTRPDVEGLQSTMTAVKDFPTAVQTVVGGPGLSSLPTLPAGSMVKAELAGPGFGDDVVTLTALPNQPLEIPNLAVAGEYSVFNIRLEDSQGNLILIRQPTKELVTIKVIEKLLVTQVTSRALTLEEIKQKGIVIDEDNFTALNFTVGLTLGSEQVQIDLPVLMPTTTEAAVKIEPPQMTRLHSVQRSFDRIKIPNFSLAGFQLRAPPEFKESTGIELPPINGVIVIPGNIGFLNQFFSVILQASNITPEASGLVLYDTRATIVLPFGGDEIKGTGDDPLRVAKTEKGGVQEVLPLLDSEGTDTIVPQGTNQAEFLVEGLREGTSKVSFDITGNLYIPALKKTVEMTGKAAGVVQVKNPTFSIVLSHPDVVREGEEYSIFATVTNTSTTPANLFQLALHTRSLSGTRLAEGEEDLKDLDILAPGQAESFEFRMVARTTGEVTGTVFLADEGVNGSFVLTTGVGDTGIPLSPDTLVLPGMVDYLPDEPDMLFQAVRLLGQAYSVATAPAGSLPPTISRISKGFVFERAVKLAQAGLHVRFGESVQAAAGDIVLEYFGSDMGRLEELAGGDPEEMARLEKDLRAYDGLRRAADAGNDLADVLGELVGTSLEGPQSISMLQREWAEIFASRPAHVSFGAWSNGSAVFLRLTDEDGKSLGRLDSAEPMARELPFADRLPLIQKQDQNGTMLFAAVPTASMYTFEWAAADPSTLELSLVLPTKDGMVHLVYPSLTLDHGGYGRMRWMRGSEPVYRFEVDTDGDGTADKQLEPLSVVAVQDRPPRLLGVQQWGKGAQPDKQPSFEFGDPLGRMVGVLFSEEVQRESATATQNYQVPGNRVTDVSLQPDGRLAFVVLDKPVGPFVQRSLGVTGVTDLPGNPMLEESRPILPDTDRGIGGTFAGQVVSAQGIPIPFATVKYIQPLQYAVLEGGCMGGLDVSDFVITTYEADTQGRFDIDYALQADFPPDCPSNPDIWLNETNPASTDNFKLEATDPESGEVGKASTRIHYDGQRMRLKVIIRGYGSLQGTVYDEADNVVAGGNPGTAEVLWVIARNVSTGEVYRSWVDEQGRYAFPRDYVAADGSHTEAPEVVVGNLILQLVRPSDGWTAVTSVNLPAGGASVTQDLVLISPNRYGAVSGRVLEVGGKKGAANVLVQVAGRVLSNIDLYSRSYSSGVVGSTHTDEEGFFRFDRVPAGDIEVRAVRQATYEEAGAKSVLAEDATQNVNLVFPGTGGTVRGVVRDAFGNLLAAATVAGGPTLTETDEHGFFEVTGLPLGSFTFFAQLKNSPALGKVTVETLGPEDVQEVVLTLEPTGGITGTVYRADGVTPVQGQKVQLWLEPNRGVIADSLTDPKGAFQFENYPLGDYSVRAVEADHGDGGMAYTSIRFAGDVRDADVTFRGLGSIRGRVVQKNGTPAISDVIVTRKVWRIFTEGDAQGDNLFMQFVRKVQEQVEEEQAEQIEKALQEAGLSHASADFFMLIDESVAVSSNIRGPNGEVTGKFEVTGVTAGPFRVAAFGPFLAPAEVTAEIPKTTEASARRVDVGDVVLEPATGSVRGTVYLPDGKTPVGAGVPVRIRSLNSSGSVMTASGGVSQPVLPEYAVETDESGKFHFPLVLRGRFILTADTGVPERGTQAGSVQEAETEQFADAEGKRLLNVRLYGRANGAVPAGETLEVDIRLLDVAGIQVKVVADDGVTPVARAQVSLKTASTLDEAEELVSQRVNADENGMISFFPIIEGRFSVGARDPDSPARGMAEGEVPVDPQKGLLIPVTVTLGAVTTANGKVVQAEFFGTVAGTVFKADGKPQDNPVQVTIKSQGVSILTTTDSGGQYRAEDVPGGRLSVEVFEPFTARRGTAGGTLAKANESIDVPVTLVGLGSVSGTVFDNDGGRRLPGLDVILFPTGRFTDKLISRTDTQGSYALPGVPLGPYTVKVNDPHSVLAGESSGTMRKEGDRNTTDIRLEPSGQITGKVYAAGVLINQQGVPVDAKGQPLSEASGVANASVTIRGTRITRTVQTDMQGEFHSGALLPLGDYTLTVRPIKGNDGVKKTATLRFEGERIRVPMALAGKGVVEGIVLDSLGQKPVPTAQVTLHSRSPFSTDKISRFSDTKGQFRFEDVPVGDFSLSLRTTVGEPELRAAAEGNLRQHGGRIVFADGDADAEHQAIRLQPAGEIVGRALHPDGSTAAGGAIVALQGQRLKLGRVADADGRFRFDAVPLGSYDLSIMESATNAVARRSIALKTNGEIADLESIVLDGEAPRVVAVSPQDSSTGVSASTPIEITFSEFIEPSSINARTFRVLVDGKRVAGRFDVSSTEPKAIFSPAAPMPDLTQVRVRLKGHRIGFEGQLLEPGIQDLAGLGLSSDFAFTYTTGDVTKPVVVRVSPVDGAADVPMRSVFRVEFSEPVDAKSIRSLTLNRDGQQVEGRINTKPILGGRVLVFSPTRPLQPNAVYTVRIEGPVQDISGNAMEEAELRFTFSTLDTLPPAIRNLAVAPNVVAVEGKTVPVGVDLEGDEDVAFVEYYLNGALVYTAREAPFAAEIYLDPGLEKPLIISAVGVDRAGNRGQQAMLPLQLVANSPPVVRIASPAPGQVSAGQVITLLVSATDDVGIEELAFTANEGKMASGRRAIKPASAAQHSFSFQVPMDFPIGSDVVLRAVAGDTLGQVAVSDTVTLAVLGKLPPAVTIVSPASESTVDPGDEVEVEVRADDPTGITEVSLSGTGVMRFSQVRTVTPPKPTYQERFVVKIPADASPTQTLALSARAVDTRGNAGSRSATVRINDRIVPVVTITPFRGKTDVEPGTEITVHVTAKDEIGVERIDLLVDGAMAHSRAIASVHETTQTFKLSIAEDIAIGGEMQVKTQVHDAAGNIGEAQVILAVRDLTAPSVEVTPLVPENTVRAGETLRIAIKATDRFGVATVQYTVADTLKVSEELSIEPAEVSVEREVALDVPIEAAGGGRLSIIAKATDQAGNVGQTNWLRVRVLDVVPPEVTSVRPADGATDVHPSAPIRLHFSEGIDRRTVNTDSVKVTGPEGPVAGSFSFEYIYSRWADFRPATPLQRGERYTVNATTAIKDPTGNPLKQALVSTFTTDNTGPRLIELLPASGAGNVPSLAVIRARFNEALKRDTVTPEAIVLVDAAGHDVDANIRLIEADRTIELHPVEALALGGTYTIKLKGVITDAAGNSITDFEAKPIEVFRQAFTVGTITFVSPEKDVSVLENAVIPLEITAEGLPIAGVVFDVNGRTLPGVSGPPFKRPYRVPALAEASQIVVTAMAQDERGKEIARKTISATVMPALQRQPAILGVATGGSSHFRLYLSVPVQADLQAELTVADPNIARLPQKLLLLKAGERELWVPVEGVTKGTTVVTVTSKHGNAAVAVAVSEPKPGREILVNSLPLGLSVMPSVYTQSLLIPETGSYTLSLPMLAAPASSDVTVEVLSTHEDVVRADGSARIPAGSRLARLSMTAKAAGETELRLRAGDTTTWLPVVVGQSPEMPGGFPGGVASREVGLAVAALSSPGTIHLSKSGTYRVAVPLLRELTPSEKQVVVSSSHLSVVEVEETTVIQAGGRMVVMNLIAKADGEAEVTLTVGDHSASVPVLVGASEIALDTGIAAQPLALSVPTPAFVGNILLPQTGVRRIAVPLLTSPAAAETAVEVSSTNADVVEIQDKAIIPAGSQLAHVSLTAKTSGSAEVKMQVADAITWLQVTVGSLPAGVSPGVAADPVGLAVAYPGTAGVVYMKPGTETSIRLPLLMVPATEDTLVKLSSRNPEIAHLVAESATIPTGRRWLEVKLVATPGAAGTALIEVRYAETLKTLAVIVGQPATGEAPVMASPTIGIEIKP